MDIKKAVDTLTMALSEDVDFYRAYQANIAMAFYDEYRRNKKKYKNQIDVHSIANTAARNFLDMLIKS